MTAIGTLLTAATVAGVALAPAASAAPAAPRSAMRAGSAAHPGAVLTSPNGRWVLRLYPRGQLGIVGPGHTAWLSRTRGSAPVLRLRRAGDLVVAAHGRALWRTETSGSGASVLRLGNGGQLALGSRGGTVWSDRLGNGCRRSYARRQVVVDISQQRARLCAHGQQVLVTRITSGASSRGAGTPLGTWRVYAKTRDTVLHPAAGGAYPVHFWMPYSGPYGMHDAPWQRFPFGSPAYRTRGSHGCVHFPERAMRRLFGWAPVGTVVMVRR